MAAASERDQPGQDGTGDGETGGHGGRTDTGDGAGQGSAGASAGGERPAGFAPEGTGPAPVRRARGLSLHWPRRRHRDGPGAALAPEVTYTRAGQRVPTGLGASLTTSSGLLLAMVEDARMRGAVEPEELRPLADTFARHSAAKEATVRKVLLRHHVATNLVERDRQEGELIQGILDKALMGRHPEETRTLTVDGALAQMYQYLSHERRDLVPAIDKAITPEDSENLAAAFEAIADA